MRMINPMLFIDVIDLNFDRHTIPVSSIVCLDYIDCTCQFTKKCKTRIVLIGNEVIYTSMSRGEIINLIREAENIERNKN